MNCGRNFLFIRQSFFVVSNLRCLAITFVRYESVSVLPKAQDPRVLEVRYCFAIFLFRLFREINGSVLSPIRTIRPPIDPTTRPNVKAVSRPNTTGVLSSLYLRQFRNHLLVLIAQVRVRNRQSAVNVRRRSRNGGQVKAIFLTFPVLPTTFQFLCFRMMVNTVVVRSNAVP